jgi:hypothetical protein
MPAKSKRQARLFGAIAGGNKRLARKTGLTRSQAREAVRGQKVRKLPERSRRKRS